MERPPRDAANADVAVGSDFQTKARRSMRTCFSNMEEGKYSVLWRKTRFIMRLDERHKKVQNFGKN